MPPLRAPPNVATCNDSIIQCDFGFAGSVTDPAKHKNRPSLEYASDSRHHESKEYDWTYNLSD
ncbi:hypothetical protein [Alteromonas sp. BMJM2]|uniref:hypothetical protein n=1 Tax=Alteromonas sp. BMJM2 TaxID=2954241 RepID=UPI0022B5DA7D|nr:hypothetical protein [Alteromonas sp. BMJM2]